MLRNVTAVVAVLIVAFAASLATTTGGKFFYHDCACPSQTPPTWATAKSLVSVIKMSHNWSRSNTMRNGFKIVLWATAGFLVAAGWGFYFATADKSIPIGPIVYVLARLTAPTAAVVLYFNPDYLLSLRAVEIANAITYAVIGLIVQTIRRHSHILHVSH
jgi:hypothetical protein